MRDPSDFLGLDRRDPVADGGSRRRVYLDTTATALMSRIVWDGIEAYLTAANANSHTDAHRAGRDTTQAIEDSRDAIGRLVGYDPVRDVVLFTSNGATGAINFLARALFPPELRSIIKRFAAGPPPAYVDALAAALGRDGERLLGELRARPLVVTSRMEHHSNLLPWMEAVGHQNVRAAGICRDGTLDMDDLTRILEHEGSRVRIVAITAVSNVTGIANPVHEIAQLAHAAGAQILVDGAQWVPHAPVRMHAADAGDLDYLVLSGHKLYAPGSRGALIGNLSTLSGRRCVTDVGGGVVEYVTIEDFTLKEKVTAREEAGTPNIPGSIAMGLVAESLIAIGMDRIEREEQALTARLLARLSAIPGVDLYGPIDQPRAGVVAFNVAGVHHAVVATYLDDFHNIAVRSGCFCAQPYIQALLGISTERAEQCQDEMVDGDHRSIPGMVRASLGLYSSADDVEALGAALEQLLSDRERIAGLYRLRRDGTAVRADGESPPVTFRIRDFVRDRIGR